TKEKKKLEKEKIKKEHIKKETANVNIVSTPIDSFFFDFFDPFLSELSEADFEALLAGVNISGGIPIVSQGS
ncbi:hypothetical protein ACHAPF_011505, partial [Botrytis cinerea]